MIHSKDKLINVKIGNQDIQRVGYGLQEESVKFLGVHLDENLDWKIQCKKVMEKIGKGNYILWRHRRILTKATRKMIYESFIRCHLTYCLTAWGHVGIKNQDITRGLKRIIKKLGPKYRHTNKRMTDYNILPLTEELKISESKIIYKWNNQEIPIGLRQLIKEKTGRTLRQRRFEISRKWKTGSIAHRLSKRATGNIETIGKQKNVKKLAQEIKKTWIEDTRTKICQVRNCFICRHDTHAA